MSAVNVGIAEVELESAALLPVGLLVNDQLYVKASLLASLLLLPFNVTVDPIKIFCNCPALATGAVLDVVVELVSIPLDPPPPPQATRRITTALAVIVKFSEFFIRLWISL